VINFHNTADTGLNDESTTTYYDTLPTTKK
jgi:hypothetical protein